MTRMKTNNFVALSFLMLILKSITNISPCGDFGETSMNFYEDFQRTIGQNTFGENFYGVHIMWMNLTDTF